MCDDMHDFMSSSQTENNLDFKFMSSPNNNRSTTHNNVPEGERSLTEQLYALRLQNQQQRVQISSLQQDVSFVRTAFSCEMERMRHEFDIRLRQLESMFRLNVDMLNKSCGKDKDKDKEKEKEKEKLKMQKKDSPDDEINMNAHERGFWRGQGQGGQGHGQESCCDDGDDTMTKFSHPPPQPMNGMAPPVSISSPRALAVHRLDAVRRSRSRGNSPNQKGRQNNIPLITPLCLPSSSSSRASNTNTNTNANNLPSSSSSATCGKRSKICTDRGSGEDITQADLVSLACSILIKYGSVPVGKMGSLLHKAANNHALPALLKERYGGLKKFLQSHDHFILGDDHPYNPHVSISPEALANHTSSPMVERMMGEVSNCRNNRKKRKARSRSISLTPQESQNIANNSNNNSSHNSTHKNINNHNHNHNHNHHNNNNNNHNNDPSVFPPSCSSGAGPSSSSSQTSVSGSSVIAPPSSSSALLNSSHPMSHNHSHAHSHSHHSQHHSHSHSSSHPRSHGHSHQHQHQHQSHNHHPHAHSHNHSHPPTHPHVHNAHAHVRPHGHGHGHSHGQHPSSHQHSHAHSHGHSQPHGHAHSRNPCQPTSAASSLFNNSQLFFPPPSSSPSMCLSSTVISSNTAGQSPSAPHTHNHSFTMTNLNKGSTPLPSASACSTGTGIGGAGFGSCIKSNSTVSGNNDNSGNSGRCSGATTSGEAATNHSDSGVNITRVTTSIAAISSTSSVGNSGGNSTSSENASKSGSYHSSSITVKTEGGSQESSSRCNARALVDEVAASLASNLHAPPICNAFMPMDSSPSAPSSRPISPPTTSNIDLDKVCQAELTDFLSMDCELIETGDSSNPNVVSRVSIVNYNSMLVYDKYVRTVVIGNDIRTNNDDSKSADELKDICAEVAAIIKDRVLVGHSVIADLKALSLTHPQHLVRDAAYYPPLCPYRPRSLKCLVKERLGVDLQGADTCSIEDARAVLAVYKSVKNEWEADVKRFYGPRPSTAHPQHSPCSGYSSAK